MSIASAAEDVRRGVGAARVDPRVALTCVVLLAAACAPVGGGGSGDAEIDAIVNQADMGGAMPSDAMSSSDGLDAGAPTDAIADPDSGGDGGDGGDEFDAARSDAMAPAIGTAGCGQAPADGQGGAQIEEMFSPAAGGMRSYFLSLPLDYDSNRPHRLVFGYAGTNWSGLMIRPYLGLERDGRSDEIVVYPDLLFRDFEGWGNLGGWLLGPHATPADGLDDIEFTRELLDRLGERYCIDPDRVFATGHSWGGDMAAVVGCFLGDRFTAVAPAAANRPYWFEPAAGPVGCVGEAAVWTFFGQADEHFAWQDFPGQFGDEQVAFWREKHACAPGEAPLPFGGAGECVAYDGCTADTRYCLYGPATGHQIPPYFTGAILEWFRGF